MYIPMHDGWHDRIRVGMLTYSPDPLVIENRPPPSQVRPGAAAERFRLEGKHALGRVDAVPQRLLA